MAKKTRRKTIENVDRAISRVFSDLVSGRVTHRRSRAQLSTIENYLRELGRKGGKATAKKLTAEQRKDSARRAAQARWAKARTRKAKERKAIQSEKSSK